MSSEVTEITMAPAWLAGALRLAAAYAVFMAAGAAVAVAACAAVLDWGFVTAALARPLGEDFWLMLLPGVAAALGAAVVHRPFMRAMRDRRDAHGWALAGVVAAHAAYVLLVFALELAGDAFFSHGAPLQPSLAAVLAREGEVALFVGGLALLFGFLPNLLVAIVFTEFVAARNRRRQSGVQLLAEVQASADVHSSSRVQPSRGQPNFEGSRP